METQDYSGTHIFYHQVPRTEIAEETMRNLAKQSSCETDAMSGMISAYTKRDEKIVYSTLEYVAQLVQDNRLDIELSFSGTGNLSITQFLAKKNGEKIGERIKELGLSDVSFHLDRRFNGKCLSSEVSKAIFNYRQFVEGVMRSAPNTRPRFVSDQGTPKDYIDESM